MAAVQCPSGCATCTSASSCQTCIPGFNISGNATNLCSANITTLAGNGTLGFGASGGAATSAPLNLPMGVAGAKTTMWIADSQNNVLRVVNTTSGITTIVAGNGTVGWSRDIGAATTTQLSGPRGLAYDYIQDFLYVADTGNHAIRVFIPAAGLLGTPCGTGVAGFAGDGGAVTAAQLNAPTAVARTITGSTWFIADSGNNRIRAVSVSTISTLAGTGVPGFGGDGGPANVSQLHTPMGVAASESGLVFIADTYNHRVRVVNASSGIISTLAGTGVPGSGGDNGPASAALLNAPTSVSVTYQGDLLFIADSGNSRVRAVNLVTGTIITVAGDGAAGFAGGLAVQAQLNSATAVCFELMSSAILIADTGNQRVRRVQTVVPVPGG